MPFEYTTHTDVDNVIKIHPRLSTKWISLGTTKQENLITYAEREIDNQKWLGRKVSNAQVGEFPRVLVIYAEEYSIYTDIDDWFKDQLILDDNVIPACIIRCIPEWIIDFMDTSAFQKFVSMQVAAGVDSFSAGSVSFSFGKERWKKPLSPNSFKLVSYLLLGWWTGANSGIIKRL